MLCSVRERLSRIHPESGRPATEYILLALALFSLGLVAVRITHTGELTYLFMPWNLFLAFVPYGLSSRLASRPWMGRGRWLMAGVFLLWLLFLPNSFYLLTDLFHLRARPGVPLWYDLALLLSFAWTGLLLGLLSLRQMQRILEIFFGTGTGKWMPVAVLVLNGLGIYIGRYLRYNSWDVIKNPVGLAGDMAHLLFHPVRNTGAWAMILCYGLLLNLLFLSVERLSRSFQSS
ncbi:MAG TPA: DUF1361 domain-containing protein [Chitinophagaceae bacterium]|nr:DUF1361 domain-containing protein [Chitinophagaceae bacterium]